MQAGRQAGRAGFVVCGVLCMCVYDEPTVLKHSAKVGKCAGRLAGRQGGFCSVWCGVGGRVLWCGVWCCVCSIVAIGRPVSQWDCLDGGNY